MVPMNSIEKNKWYVNFVANEKAMKDPFPKRHNEKVDKIRARRDARNKNKSMRTAIRLLYLNSSLLFLSIYAILLFSAKYYKSDTLFGMPACYGVIWLIVVIGIVIFAETEYIKDKLTKDVN